MSETAVELLPCPFCGGEAEIVHSMENDPPCHYDSVRVRCKNCHASIEKRISDGYYGMYCDDETISKLWNNRAALLRFTKKIQSCGRYSFTDHKEEK